MKPRVLGLVPARGGSKGLPRKNIRLLHGKPLLAYTVDAAVASGVIDRLVLSTDDEEIRRVGIECGLEAPFLRPAPLASDEAPMLGVIRHAVDALAADQWAADVVVLLQPTSPLRTGEHIRTAVQMLLASDADSVVTVLELPRHYSPDYVMRIEDGRLVNFLADGARVTRRQDARPAYVREGTAYVFRIDTLRKDGNIYGKKCLPLLLPDEQSLTIDTAADWQEAERRLAARHVTS